MNVMCKGLQHSSHLGESAMDMLLCAGLSSVQDTESIVAKAIRDGGIDAVIDHANGWMLSNEIADIYSTSEPAAAFHARTAFCLDIHNEVCLLFSP